MASIVDIVDERGRVDYGKLWQFAGNLQFEDLTEQSKYPFLIGKDFYDGVLQHDGLQDDRYKTTVRFSITDSRNLGKDAALMQTPTVKIPFLQTQEHSTPNDAGRLAANIYLIRHRPSSQQQFEDIVFIGRSSTNDIVISDCAMSKRHSQITFIDGDCYISDLGSTNGTKINHRDLAPGEQAQLHFNDTLAFGRIVFVFANPLGVYSNLKRMQTDA